MISLRRDTKQIYQIKKSMTLKRNFSEKRREIFLWKAARKKHNERQTVTMTKSTFTDSNPIVFIVGYSIHHKNCIIGSKKAPSIHGIYNHENTIGVTPNMSAKIQKKIDRSIDLRINNRVKNPKKTFHFSQSSIISYTDPHSRCTKKSMKRFTTMMTSSDANTLIRKHISHISNVFS